MMIFVVAQTGGSSWRQRVGLTDWRCPTDDEKAEEGVVGVWAYNILELIYTRAYIYIYIYIYRYVNKHIYIYMCVYIYFFFVWLFLGLGGDGYVGRETHFTWVERAHADSPRLSSFRLTRPADYHSLDLVTGGTKNKRIFCSIEKRKAREETEKEKTKIDKDRKKWANKACETRPGSADG